MIPLYIFDLDGTLSDASHRQHLVADKKNADWDAFYQQSRFDNPKQGVIDLFDLVQHQGNDVYIFSGRSDIVREETENWLATYTSVSRWQLRSILRMRPHGDSTPDDVLKEQWLNELSEYDRRRLRMTFDDRNRVVAMWRRNGVTCCQVAEGDF